MCDDADINYMCDINFVLWNLSSERIWKLISMTNIIKIKDKFLVTENNKD